MNSEQITAFLQEHWCIASVLIGAVILIGAIRNWNWLCDPAGTRDAHRHSRGIPTGEPLAPVLERFRKATQREPVYQCIFHEDDGSLTESYGLMFE